MNTLYAFFAGIALTGAGLIAAPTASYAAKLGNEYMCAFTDKRGNKLGYFFGPNTDNTLVERRFVKNKTVTASESGARPVWRITKNRLGGAMLIPQGQSQWRIGNDTSVEQLSHVARTNAWLYRGETIVASGGCGFAKVDVDSDEESVGDAGL